MQDNGLDLGIDYSYKGVEGTCKYSSSTGKVGTMPLKDYTQVEGGSSGSWASTTNMKAAIDIKPNAVSVHASSSVF